MILVDEKKLGNALKACLSDSEFPLERRQAVLRAIRKEEKVVKKKISAALVFAIVLTLVVGGAALAANLGVFGQSVNDQQNEQSVGRLEKLENASATYNDTQAAQAPEQTATEAPKTVYDELMASLYNRRFNLTLNQAYFDGYKLYYSYTLTSDCKTGFITGDGMPTGFEKWDDTQEGKFVGHYSLYDDNMNQEVVTYFSAHPSITLSTADKETVYDVIAVLHHDADAMVQLMFIFFGMPYLGLTLSRELSIFIAFTLNYTAYFIEILRGALSAVDPGQAEAGKMLGFSRRYIYFRIQLPQALRTAMPSIGNEVLNLVKDTSLIYVLGASEPLKAGRSAVNTYATALPFVVVGILYLAMCGGFSWLLGRIEKRISYY